MNAVCRPLSLLVAVLLACGCSAPGSAAPVIKVGLIAPFEGMARPLGYAVLPAVRDALSEANVSGRLGRYKLALVALNDDLQPAESAARARELALDPTLVAVIGPWSVESVSSTIPVLIELGLPGVLPVPSPAPAPAVLQMCPSLDEVANRALGAATGAGEVVGDGPVAAWWRLASPGANPGIRLVDLEAEMLAGQLRDWRDAGWSGRVIAGPDAFRAWFGELAGNAGEGVAAVACIPPGISGAGGSPSADGGDQMVLQTQAALAMLAIERIVDAVAGSVAAGETPGRAAIGERLSPAPPAGHIQILTQRNGRWE